MLVVTRKKGQSIHIGNSIVEVLDSRGDRIKLGNTAPRLPLRTR